MIVQTICTTPSLQVPHYQPAATKSTTRSWFLRIPIGISASRYDAGRLLEDQFPVEVHLLDDGFQHVALHRDLDLVLIDAENPWGRRGAFPSLLRESPAALARADAVLLTRCELLPSESEDSVETLRGAMLRWNSSAQFFAVSTRLIGFYNAKNDALIPADAFRSLRPFAFCGLGNPRAFFRTLERSGVPVAGQKIFPDHHRYLGSELAALEKAAEAAGASCLLTTEKDWLNLLPGANPSLPLYCTQMDLIVEEESRLLRWISSRLELPESGLSDPSSRPPGLGRRDEEPPQARMVSESKLNR